MFLEGLNKGYKKGFCCQGCIEGIFWGNIDESFGSCSDIDNNFVILSYFCSDCFYMFGFFVINVIGWIVKWRKRWNLNLESFLESNYFLLWKCLVDEIFDFELEFIFKLMNDFMELIEDE